MSAAILMQGRRISAAIAVLQTLRDELEVIEREAASLVAIGRMTPAHAADYLAKSKAIMSRIQVIRAAALQ